MLPSVRPDRHVSISYPTLPTSLPANLLGTQNERPCLSTRALSYQTRLDVAWTTQPGQCVAIWALFQSLAFPEGGFSRGLLQAEPRTLAQLFQLVHLFLQLRSPDSLLAIHQEHTMLDQIKKVMQVLRTFLMLVQLIEPLLLATGLASTS